jgi:hypothetical protein
MYKIEKQDNGNYRIVFNARVVATFMNDSNGGDNESEACYIADLLVKELNMLQDEIEALTRLRRKHYD